MVAPVSRLRRCPHAVVAAALGLLSLSLTLWQLTQHGYLSFYDSGVLFASAIHLVSGVMPYRDFTLDQPPGLILLMAPVALLGRVIGTEAGLAFARILTAAVAAGNVTMTAWLVRRWGRLAMIVAGLGLTFTPVAIFDTTAVELEPWCVAFVLLGACIYFSTSPRESPKSTKVLVLTGLCFGLAASVKLFAFFPFVALLIVEGSLLRRRVWTLVAAAGAGLAVPTVPFLLAAPRALVSQVFVDQLFSNRQNFTRGMGLVRRLTYMMGTSVSSSSRLTQQAIALGLSIALILLALLLRDSVTRLDLFLVAFTALTAVGFLLAPFYFVTFTYFLLPPLWAVIGLSISRCWRATEPVRRRWRASEHLRVPLRWSLVVASVLALTGVVLRYTTYYDNTARLYGFDGSGTALRGLAAQLPAHSCVVYDIVGFGVLADRLRPASAGCPAEVDPAGMSMAWGFRTYDPLPGYVTEWRRIFEHAQYVVQEVPFDVNIPWTPDLRHWFDLHFRQVGSGPYFVVYQNVNDGRPR